MKVKCILCGEIFDSTEFTASVGNDGSVVIQCPNLCSHDEYLWEMSADIEKVN